ncbi:hypothetical protein [Natrialba swarupiae]|uniref:Uncharacterized protein n=1 Tax=Natrialba swarupiae TaxID=2448032 RepID=A0A5D5AJL5_9EURY|nr:hypothetical protein [Natrialba swarupiae]TYT61866.1 hypothetical protein FYC77_11555 [Natrialba swarupiae]
MHDRDKYTRLVLEGSEYEFLRARRALLSRWTIPQKIRRCSYLLFAASSMLPIMLFLPAVVQQQHVGSDPAFSRVSFTALTLFSVCCLVGASLGLAATATYRDGLENISEEQAWSLVGIEGLFSGIGFVSGSLGVTVTLVLSAVGYAGAETVDSLIASGVDPYHSKAGIAVTVATASAIAFCCAITVFLLSVFVESLE